MYPESTLEQYATQKLPTLVAAVQLVESTATMVINMHQTRINTGIAAAVKTPAKKKAKQAA